jgi:hypothetical protein
VQTIAVFVIVALAAVYATWKLSPRALKGRLAERVVRLARRHAGLSDGAADELSRRLNGGGCGSCDACGTDSAKADAAAGAAVVHYVPRPPAKPRSAMYAATSTPCRQSDGDADTATVEPGA